MTELEISAGSRVYPVHIERNSLSNVGELFSLDRKALILSDDMIPTEYIEKVTCSAKEAHTVVLPHGESAKSPENYLLIIKTMLDLGFDRGDALVAVGGGVVCDIGGFVAATYMRGIDFYTVPTSLLAQVDASVGGKVAIDFCGYKNAVGTFYQPSAVIVDTELLKTLPEHEFSAGMAEVIKTFAITDRETFEKLENATDIKNPELIDEIVFRALKIKKKFVEQDEKDTGVRAALNFGHTVGHAVESVCKDMLHGECVGVGMLALTEGDVQRRIKNLLENYSLPTCAVCKETEFVNALTHDKKSIGDSINTVRVREIGKYEFQKSSASDILNESREVIKFI